jgi:hypothetical protein
MKPYAIPKYLHYYLIGVVDSEGCFTVAIKRVPTAKMGYTLDPLFKVVQHKKNRIILDLLKQELQCGRIFVKPGQPDLLEYQIDNRKLLVDLVIKFFDENQLLAKKDDYTLFKEIVYALERKEHLHRGGFIALLDKIYQMNLAGKQRKRSKAEIIETMREPSETTREKHSNVL